MNIEIRGRKILLIGNGFDLAHGLPTSYSYFLDFCDKVEKKFNFQSGINEKDYKTNELNDWNIDDSIKSKLYEWDKNTNILNFPKKVQRKFHPNNKVHNNS